MPEVIEDLSSHAWMLAEIRREWDKAEETIKKAEQVCGKVVTPAIKELRYAGRRLVDMLNGLVAGEPKKEIENYLADAVFDCYRARHDAIDAATSQMAKDLRLKREYLGLDNVLKVFPAFPQLWAELNDVKAKIAESRKNRTDRNAIYATVDATDFPGLVRMYESLMESEPLMRSLAKRERRNLFASYSIGIVGIILGIFGILK